MDALNEMVLKTWGAFGITIVIMMAGLISLWKFLGKIRAEHKSEREEWRETADNQFNKLFEISEQTNKALNGNQNLLSEIKGILETIKKTA